MQKRGFIKQSRGVAGINEKEIASRPQHHLSGDKSSFGLLPHKFPSLLQR
ncbi:hypothetical protein IJ579_04790 [bacterium]|nr:hypothetical protein [bacterium]